jgi:hypothetical protein
MFRQAQSPRAAAPRQGQADRAIADHLCERVESFDRRRLVEVYSNGFGIRGKSFQMRFALKDAAVAGERSIENSIAERQPAICQIETGDRTFMQGPIVPEHVPLTSTRAGPIK